MRKNLRTAFRTVVSLAIFWAGSTTLLSWWLPAAKVGSALGAALTLLA